MNGEKHHDGKWRLLGPEPPAPLAAADAPRPSPADLSAARLMRPLFTVSVGQGAWIAIAVYAILSRLILLDAHPLTPSEARHALAALDIARRDLSAIAHPPMPIASWLDLMEAGLFSAIGVGDFAARLGFAIGGLVLIATAASMRPYLGRFGAIAFAALLTISPSVTYFSRSGSSVIIAIAFALIALRFALALDSRPSVLRGVALGLAAGLALNADRSSYAALAIAALALVLWGLWEALTISQPRLRFRLWLARHAAAIGISAAVTIAVCAILGTGVFSSSLAGAIGNAAHATWPASQLSGYRLGCAAYLPALSFYEFLIAILALEGLAAIFYETPDRRFSRWCALWTATSLGWWLFSPAREPGLLLWMLIPMAMLAAAGADFLYRLDAWRFIRYALASLAALTVYVQLLTSFVYSAPDAHEAPWARHASLFWSDPATTVGTPAECEGIAARARSIGAAIRFDDDAPALKWYLRDFVQRSAPAPDALIVEACAQDSPPDSQTGQRLDIAQSWVPDLAKLTPAAAMHHLFAMRAWSALTTQCAEIIEKKPAAVLPEAPGSG